MPLPIEDYALIGDCETAALVGRDGSIDWLCWPRFDSDACFAALLGTEDNGRWRIAPRDPATRVTRQYRRNTLILETRFECDEGAVTLIDFMPVTGSSSSVVRLVVGERGRVAMSSRACDPFRLWRDRPLGHAARRRHVARCRRAGHGGAAHAGRSHRPEHEDHRRVRRSRPASECRSSSPTRRRICRRRTRSARPGRSRRPKGSGRAGPRIAGRRDTARTRSCAR